MKWSRVWSTKLSPRRFEWEIIKEGQTDPPKISADHRMIAIVDDEEIQKRERHLEYRKIHEQTHRGHSLSGLNQMGEVIQRFDPHHWIKLANSSSRSWEFNVTDKGELNLAEQHCRQGSQKRSNTLYPLCCGLQRKLRGNGPAEVNVFTGYII